MYSEESLSARQEVLNHMVNNVYNFVSKSKHHDNFCFNAYSGSIFDTATTDTTGRLITDTIEHWCKVFDISETHLIGAVIADPRFEIQLSDTEIEDFYNHFCVRTHYTAPSIQ